MSGKRSTRKTSKLPTSRQTKWPAWRLKLWGLLENPHQTLLGKVLHNMLMGLIILNVAVQAMETLDGPHQEGDNHEYDFLPTAATFDFLGACFSIIFSVEIFVRALVAENLSAFIRSPLTWCDIAAVFPFYVETIVNTDTLKGDAEDLVGRAFNLIKLFRVLRIVTMARHFYGTAVLAEAVRASIKPLLIIFFFFITSTMVCATILFYAEPCYDKSSCTFTDIFNAAYFVVVTVTTVGFGDQVPDLSNPISTNTTVLAVVLGSLFLSMPLAIIGNNFNNAWRRQEPEERRSETLVLRDYIQEESSFHKLDFQFFDIDARLNVVMKDYLELTDDLDALDQLFVAHNQTRASAMSISDVSVQPSQVSIWLETNYVDAKKALVSCIDSHSSISFILERLSSCRIDAFHDEIAALESHKPVIRNNFFQEELKQPRKKTKHKLKRDYSVSKRSFQESKSKRNFSECSRRNSDASEQEEFVPEVEKPGLRDRLWFLLEVPDSSRAARLLHSFIMALTYASVFLFYAQTMPELHDYGTHSVLCEEVIQEHCMQYSADTGCLARNEGFIGKPLRYFCDELDCYGVGANFGSSMSVCNDTIFAMGDRKVCNRLQCNNSHKDTNLLFDASPFWPFLEWFFGISFTVEFIVRLIASGDFREFFGDYSNIIDLACLMPFYVELFESIKSGRETRYEVVAANPSFISAMRMLKTIRILKLARHFEGTSVLLRTFKLSSKRLTIPLFFLFLACLLFGGIMYEIERGKTCVIGQPCIWRGQNLTDLPIVKSRNFSVNTTVMIQHNHFTTVTDMYRSAWLGLITFTSVGYGDITPYTALGKLIAIFGMVFGACYTAMPLTLVGNQFFECYEEFEANERGEERRSSTPLLTRRESKVLAHVAMTDEEYQDMRKYHVVGQSLRALDIKLEALYNALVKAKQVKGKFNRDHIALLLNTLGELRKDLFEITVGHMGFAPRLRILQKRNYIGTSASMQ